ncbi:hypothetical protein Chor_005733 [Crotalus horridus]
MAAASSLSKAEYLRRRYLEGGDAEVGKKRRRKKKAAGRMRIVDDDDVSWKSRPAEEGEAEEEEEGDEGDRPVATCSLQHCQGSGKDMILNPVLALLQRGELKPPQIQTFRHHGPLADQAHDDQIILPVSPLLEGIGTNRQIRTYPLPEEEQKQKRKAASPGAPRLSCHVIRLWSPMGAARG